MATGSRTTDRVAGNLPSPRASNSFVGRKALTATVRQQLVNSRLVTLTGVGGVGKTRLALHVAQQLGTSGFPDGIWLIDLTPHRDAELVIDAIATTLGLSNYSERTTLDALTGYLAKRRSLLVLDNCEHVIDGVALTVATLLDQAPALRILVTSREPLRISGEHLVLVPPLAVPPLLSEPFGSPDTMPYDAVRLLIARTEAMGMPDFGSTSDPALVARLVRRLDGIPLAIVLAAARLYSLSLETVLDQLDDRFNVLTHGDRDAPDHHKTLWSSIEWSYDRCSPPQQVLWQRLTVFSGHFTSSDAVTVCSDELGDTIDGHKTVDLLSDLVRQSVLQHESDSYHLLEMVREYGLAQQKRDGDQESLRLQQRHAEYYRATALDCASGRFLQDATAIPTIRQGMANFRAALEWFTTHGDATSVLTFAVALTDAAAWFTAASLTEGRRYLSRAMAIPGPPSIHRVIVAANIAWYAVLQEDPESADWVERCRRETQGLDALATAFASWAEGLYLCFVEESENSIHLLAAALEEFRNSGQSRYVYLCSVYLTNAGLKFKDYETAETASRQSLEYTESHGDEHAISWARLTRSMTILSRGGEVKRARELLHKSLRVQLQLGAHWGLDWVVQALSWAATLEKQYGFAAQLMGAAAKLRTISAQDKNTGLPFYDDIEQAAHTIRQYLSPEEYQSAFNFGLSLTPDKAISLALGDTSDGVSNRTASAISSPKLSSRQFEVAALVAKGYTNREIGEKLYISPRTVDTHVQAIMNKLDTNKRTDIALWFGAHHEPYADHSK